MTDIYVDGDACPVREEIYRVAARLQLNVLVVYNGSRPIRPPAIPNVRMVLVGDTADAADDWIAEHVSAVDVCVTSDIPLGSRCLKKGRASSPLPANIGRRRISVTHALAGRPSRFCSSSGSKAVSVPTTPRRASGTGVRAVRQSASGPEIPFSLLGEA